MTIQELADLILAQRRERLASQYSQAQADNERVDIKPGKVYTKIDRGPAYNMSGFLMIDPDGSIYGIRGYGVVNKKHAYGTLATAEQWYWGNYRPEKI